MDDGPFYLDDDLMRLVGLIPSPATTHRASAFAAYQQRPRTGGGTAALLGWLPSTQHFSSGGGVNVHRSMHQYLLTSMNGAPASSTGSTTLTTEAPPADELPTQQTQVVRHSSRFRHIMRERLRRERLSQGYANLQALLPPGRASKGVKNSVVGAAADYIKELERRKDQLSARNEELSKTAAARSGGARGGHMVVKVRAERGCHRSMVDVFEVVLRRLKAMAEADRMLRVTAIQSRFCSGVMRMDVGVESKVSSSQVEMAVRDALMELQETESACLIQLQVGACPELAVTKF